MMIHHIYVSFRCIMCHFVILQSSDGGVILCWYMNFLLISQFRIISLANSNHLNRSGSAVPGS